MKAVIQAEVRACDPPMLAVRVDEYTVAVSGPDALGRLSRVDTIARETRQAGGGEQVSIVAVYGVPATSPVPPAVIHNLSVKQEPIAWVTVGPTQWEVRQEHIHTEWPPPARSDASDPDLASWLLEQVRHDRDRAEAACVKGHQHWRNDYGPLGDLDVVDDANRLIVSEMVNMPNQAEHIARWDPARVLAECDAKRQIVAKHYIIHRDIGFLEEDEGELVDAIEELPVCGYCVPKHSAFNRRAEIPIGPCWTVRVLALPYADRDGYREEWKP